MQVRRRHRRERFAARPLDPDRRRANNGRPLRNRSLVSVPLEVTSCHWLARPPRRSVQRPSSVPRLWNSRGTSCTRRNGSSCSSIRWISPSSARPKSSPSPIAATKFDEARRARCSACSIDSQFTHLAWRNTPRKEGGLGEITLSAGRRPEQGDRPRLRRAAADGGVALRGLFIIDPKGVVRHATVNDLPRRPQRRRGPAHGPGLPVRREARRGLPGQLAARRRHDEARSGGSKEYFSSHG